MPTPLWIRAVHPRVCGEQLTGVALSVFEAGSSPRVRGTGCSPCSQKVRSRFIPACAGNSPDWPITGIVPAVHPRVCGEQEPPAVLVPGRVGSSPRVRGTVTIDCQCSRAMRFIPACAGNRRSFCGKWALVAVHPRVCGEQCSARRSSSLAAGSSPRVRGTVLILIQPVFYGRFIPACAGNRRQRQESPVPSPVHPRVCGEQEREPEPSFPATGSSPRVRGTVERGGLQLVHDRFIPACAGNRFTISDNSKPWSVHPRVCGEQVIRSIRFSSPHGSSPRVRGTD